MNSELNLWEIILNASIVVQLVIGILLLFSLLSWALIFDRARALKRARRLADAFEQRFWAGGDLTDLYNAIDRDSKVASGMAVIFQTGFKEFARLKRSGHKDPIALVQGTQRAMRVVLNREMATLEASLPFLATVGSISPYIGLFGTVWGIMHSFHALGNTKQQATLAMVAPGISEALVATAIGLFAAIPAVIAYNRYIVDVERLNNRYDDFLEEFSTILQRQTFSDHVKT
jgi:biopolymer transport protein TolQ